MSTVIILAPVIIANWGAISAAVVGAAAALGFTVHKTAQEEVQQVNQNLEALESVEMELADSEVLAQNLTTSQQLVVTKGDVKLVVGRDARGRCKVCATGKGHSKAELKQIADEFTQKLTQCFVYNKVMKQLKAKNFQVVNEEVTQNQDIRIHVRRWVD